MGLGCVGSIEDFIELRVNRDCAMQIYFESPSRNKILKGGTK
jgi:hypothetical protein